MHAEPTTTDILEAIHSFSSSVDERFDRLETDVQELKTDVRALKTDMVGVKSSMVTKDYLDEKIADLRGDLILMARKGNTKLSTLVEDLVAKKTLDLATARKILALEPFPQGKG